MKKILCIALTALSVLIVLAGCSYNDVLTSVPTPSSLKQSSDKVVSEFTQVTVIRAVDGDTLLVEDETGEEIRVRLIGIDTPESVNPDESKNTQEGETASDYLKSIIQHGDTVYLEYDEDKEDNYGRDLCYVWLSDNVNVNSNNDAVTYMLNANIIANGYANTMTIDPNTKYCRLFEVLKQNAKLNSKGFWNDENTIQRLKW